MPAIFGCCCGCVKARGWGLRRVWHNHTFESRLIWATLKALVLMSVQLLDTPMHQRATFSNSHM